jgi:hypothetical protein
MRRRGLYTYTCTCMRTNTQTHAREHIYTHKHTGTHAHVHTHTHTHTRAHTHTQLHARMHMHAHIARVMSFAKFSVALTCPDVQAGAVHLYLAHLANRLLELSKEDRAAHIITQALRQRVWEKKCGESCSLVLLRLPLYWRYWVQITACFLKCVPCLALCHDRATSGAASTVCVRASTFMHL